MSANGCFALIMLLWGSLALAADPQLHLISEHPVNGMRGGNLSGLALCGQTLWTVSDRDDDQIYRLDTRATVWQAHPVVIHVPAVPNASDRPLKMKVLNGLATLVHNVNLDYEAISCDDSGNRYVLSETYSAVLQITPNGEAFWLPILRNVVHVARTAGMLQETNALFEGLAVAPRGNWLVLAAERERRGLVRVEASVDGWTCPVVNCVIRAEMGQEIQPPQFPDPQLVSLDFSDVALFGDKLFTLNRNAFKICRFALAPIILPERCWSFAADALTPPRLYPSIHGMAEALVIDNQGAWVGIDNNSERRADGEKRPVVFRFASPSGGWLAKP
ncbi:esterase-like activity of phytase family protein [Pseudomonas frederiksbergensis]|uniref:esterase-like activity of phytase family protein n=1 Tax=Pseudomonas frederiksbergensis TaxID=104087 RepID=UPI003D23FB10